MELSLHEARRVALAAQGFGRKAGNPTPAQVRTLASRVLALQLDAINVLVRSHYLPVYSRLGPYRMAAVDVLAYERRELFECWGHAACLMPVSLFPLMRHRMEAQREASPWTPDGSRPEGRYIGAVYDEVAERGPLAAGDLSEGGKRKGKWWGWSNGKMALEHLLSCGLVQVSGRRGFTRVYDIAERVIPPEVLDAPWPAAAEAQKELLCLSAKALGVATAATLGGYLGLHSFRVRVRGDDGKWTKAIWPRLLSELVEEGRIVRVEVEGWTEPGYALPRLRIPANTDVRALLSPFDSFMRGPAQTCCGFTQPLAQQLYVPAEKRVYGYYVLPFLLDDTFVARCDLKADRKRGVLMVQSAFLEPGHDPSRVAGALADELRDMQAWLELDGVEVARRGNLAARLRRTIRPVRAGSARTRP